MLPKLIELELNKQINKELYSAYLYMSYEAFYKTKNLNGFAHWMHVQVQEEQAHVTKFFNYVLERGGNIEFEQIEKPKSILNNLIDPFDQAYIHEQHITARINHMIDVSIQEKDHATAMFLQWFINEQVEEEANTLKVLEELKLIEGKGAGLFMMDRELQNRIFVDPNVAV